MYRIVRHAVADQFSKNRRAARLCKFEVFEHQHAGPFSEYKSAAVRCKRFARLFGRLLVFDGEGHERFPAFKYTEAEHGFSTTSQRNIQVTVGNGAGGFTLGNSVALAGTPRGLAVGNMNTADSIPDVAVTQLAGSNGVRVLFGKGDGTLLTTGGTVALPGRDPRSVAIGDLNKDGKADLVTGDSNEDELSIALGDGAGVFATPTRVASGNFPLGVALTDANGDGNLDAVYLSRNDPDSVTDQAQPRAVRLLGKGDGTFLPDSALRVETGSSPLDIVLGDISGDGKLDAVVASSGANAAFTHIIRADGAILPGTSRRAGVGARAIALAKVGSGVSLDILTVNSDNTFSLIQNSGSNAFTLIATYHAGNDAIEGVAGDFDKDGRVDFALANRTTNDIGIVFGTN